MLFLITFGGGPSSLCTLHKSNKYIMFNYGPIEGSIVYKRIIRKF